MALVYLCVHGCKDGTKKYIHVCVMMTANSIYKSKIDGWIDR